MADPTDIVAVVTGSNTGIGRATAAVLAERGATVVLACRSETKTTPVIDELKASTGNPNIEFLALDLADLHQVRGAAAELLERHPTINLLVNNAGVAGQRGLTKDGFEITFGVNHLGHFLFTTLLLDRIVATGAATELPARIVNVSSGNHFAAKSIDWDAVRKPTAHFTGLHEYNVSKLANVLFTAQLVDRLDPSSVVSYSVNPGPVASDVWRRIPGPLYAVFQFVRRMKSTADGAKPSLHAALEPGIESINGTYFDQDCRPKAASKYATPELGQELWKRSEDWVAAVP